MGQVYKTPNHLGSFFRACFFRTVLRQEPKLFSPPLSNPSEGCFEVVLPSALWCHLLL